HAEEAHEETSAVVAHDAHALAGADAPLVEGGGLGPRQLGDAPVGEGAEPAAGRIGLVDDADAVGVDECGSFEMIGNSQRHAHGWCSTPVAPVASRRCALGSLVERQVKVPTASTS